MKTPQDRCTRRCARWAAAAVAIAAALPTQAYAAGLLAGGPRVAPNPNPRAPLVAVLTFDAARRAGPRVEVDDGRRLRVLDFAPVEPGTRTLPIIGLRADTAHRLRLTLREPDGRLAEPSAWIDYRTPPLPLADHGFPPIEITKADTARMEPGYTLVSIRRAAVGRSPWRTDRQFRFGRQWGCLVILDDEGQVVWYYLGDSRTAGVKQLDNGNILIHRADSTLTEIDMLGNPVRQWYPQNHRGGGAQAGAPANMITGAVPIEGLEALHHQPFQMPNGNYLSFGAHARRIPGYYTSETDPAAPRREQLVVGDRVVEFDAAGRIVWSWDTFDHLDPLRIGYELTASYWQTRGFEGGLDWTHGNGVSYDSRTGVVLASFRHQDASIAIDRRTGQIRWILGEPTDWGPLQSKVLKPVGALRWPYHSHNPRFTQAGTVIMFDNGTWGARPFRKPIDPIEHFSRAVEYEVDEQAMTVRQVWTSGDTLTPDSCSSIAMSDAWRLPKTDNILVFYALCLRNRPGMSWNDNGPLPSPEDQAPNASRIREYTRTATPEIVFEALIRDPNDLVVWEVYGGQRIPSLYPGTRPPAVR